MNIERQQRPENPRAGTADQPGCQFQNKCTPVTDPDFAMCEANAKANGLSRSNRERLKLPDARGVEPWWCQIDCLLEKRTVQRFWLLKDAQREGPTATHE